MNNNPFSLIGKSILVTGAASGIGRQTAISCSEMGASVCLTDINRDGLVETMAMLATNGTHSFFQANLTNEDEVNSLVLSLPSIDGFANVAGIGNTSPVQFFKMEDITKVYNINTFAPIFLTKALINKRKLKNPSSLVYVVSLAGVGYYTPGNGIYGTSKSALNSYVHFAARELANRGIRCNAINPAMVETALTQKLDRTEESIKSDIMKYPLKRYGTSKDIANSIVFLLSDASSWITGHSLIIDGGRSLV